MPRDNINIMRNAMVTELLHAQHRLGGNTLHSQDRPNNLGDAPAPPDDRESDDDQTGHGTIRYVPMPSPWPDPMQLSPEKERAFRDGLDRRQERLQKEAEDRARKEAAAAARREKELAEGEERRLQTLADENPWYIHIQPLRMWADGSDIDEIYGRIDAIAIGPDGPLFNDFGNSDPLNLLNTGKATLNLTDREITSIKGARFQAPSSVDGSDRVSVQILFQLYDEDGHRDFGEGDDDQFQLEDNGHVLVHAWHYDEVPIRQGLAFKRESRVKLQLRSKNNRIWFFFRSVAFRALE